MPGSRRTLSVGTAGTACCGSGWQSRWELTGGLRGRGGGHRRQCKGEQGRAENSEPHSDIEYKYALCTSPAEAGMLSCHRIWLSASPASSFIGSFQELEARNPQHRSQCKWKALFSLQEVVDLFFFPGNPLCLQSVAADASAGWWHPR